MSRPAAVSSGSCSDARCSRRLACWRRPWVPRRLYFAPGRGSAKRGLRRDPAHSQAQHDRAVSPQTARQLKAHKAPSSYSRLRVRASVTKTKGSYALLDLGLGVRLFLRLDRCWRRRYCWSRSCHHRSCHHRRWLDRCRWCDCGRCRGCLDRCRRWCRRSRLDRHRSRLGCHWRCLGCCRSGRRSCRSRWSRLSRHRSRGSRLGRCRSGLDRCRHRLGILGCRSRWSWCRCWYDANLRTARIDALF